MSARHIFEKLVIIYNTQAPSLMRAWKRRKKMSVEKGSLA
jgi:hypothetical protein